MNVAFMLSLLLTTVLLTDNCGASSVLVDPNEVSFDAGCYQKNATVNLTARYSGSGTVEDINWYYEKRIAGNYVIKASDCSKAGIDKGFPEDRISFECGSRRTYKLILSPAIKEDVGKKWGASFSLLAGGTTELKTKTLQECSDSTSTSGGASGATIVAGIGVVISIASRFL